MKRLLYILIFLLLSVFLYGANAYAEFDESTVIAVVKPQADSFISLFSYNAPFGDLEIEESENLDVTASSEISLFSVSYEEKTYKLTLTNKGYDEVLEAVEYLNTLDNIEYAQPNYIYRISSVPDDPDYSSQYSLSKVGAPYVWDMGIDCSGVTVAVIDSGVEISHPDLAANIWTNPGEKAKSSRGRAKDNDNNGYKNDTCGWDFIDNDADPSDENGHGTHVAGIISASTNNGEGVASLAKNAKLVPLRIMDAEGKGTTDGIYKAIKYVNKMGFDIVNMSLGGEGMDETVQNAIKNTNAVFVCAAGNEASDNDTTPVYPANINSSNVISVASTTSGDTLSYFSNYGAETVDIAAPGSYIYSTYLDSTYEYLSGTSMACPLVASAAAVVKAKYPSMTPAEIVEKLKSSADAVSSLKDKTITGGRLNAYEALLIHAESVTLNKNTVALEAGETEALSVEVLPSNTTDTAVWSSADETVATVENGIVTAVGAGSTEITVRYGSVNAVCRVVVTAPTPTPTVEPTPTPSSTPSPTPSPSPTPTASPSPTPTATPSPSPTPSPTPTPTPSPSPTTTATPTASPSPTPIATPTAAPIIVITPTPSPTPTATPLPSPTPTPTATPSPSPTPTPTASPSPTPTASPSPTPTATPTPSPSPTPTATPTPSPSPTPTPSPSPTPTPEPTATPTVEPTAVPTTEPEIIVDPIEIVPVEPLDRVEFELIEDGTIKAKLIFEVTEAPEAENIRVYIVYRDKETGVLNGVEIKEVSEEFETYFAIPQEFSDCDITLYVWDKEMKPLMEIQKYEIS